MPRVLAQAATRSPGSRPASKHSRSNALRDVTKDDWMPRLLAPVQGGIYGFRANEANGQRIAVDQQSLSVVPGAELQILLGDRAVLKPFAQFGLAHTFGGDLGNPGACVYLAGARSVAPWRSGEFTFSLCNGVVFAGDKSIGPDSARTTSRSRPAAKCATRSDSGSAI